MRIILSILLLLFCCGAAEAKSLSLEEIREATVRVDVDTGRSQSYGTGTVFYREKDGDYLILTNYHVVESNRDVGIRFYKGGFRTIAIPGTVILSAYQNRSSVDMAIVEVKDEYLGNFKPRIIPLAPSNLILDSRTIIKSAGCPQTRDAMAWLGHIIEDNGNTVSFNPPPIRGQSGSGIIVDINGSSRLAGLLTWSVKDEYGAGMSIKHVRAVLRGETSFMPIPATYKITADKYIKKGCKHPNCGLSKYEHVLGTDGLYYCWPKDGGPIKFHPGVVAADPYVRTQLTRCPPGAHCPLNPWNRPPRPQPPQGPIPPNPGGGGGGIFEGQPPVIPEEPNGGGITVPEEPNGGGTTAPNNDEAVALLEEEKQKLQIDLAEKEQAIENTRQELSITKEDLENSNWFRNLWGIILAALPIPGGAAGWVIKRKLDKLKEKLEGKYVPDINEKIVDVINDLKVRVDGIKGDVDTKIDEIRDKVDGSAGLPGTIVFDKALEKLKDQIAELLEDKLGVIRDKIQPLSPFDHGEYRSPPPPIIVTAPPASVPPVGYHYAPQPQPEFSANDVMGAVDDVVTRHSNDPILSQVGELVRDTLKKRRKI